MFVAIGEAYVQFKNVEQAKAALGHDQRLINNRFIEVFRSNEEERAQV
jgi:hypothetical protein